MDDYEIARAAIQVLREYPAPHHAQHHVSTAISDLLSQCGTVGAKKRFDDLERDRYLPDDDAEYLAVCIGALLSEHPNERANLTAMLQKAGVRLPGAVKRVGSKTADETLAKVAGAGVAALIIYLLGGG